MNRKKFLIISAVVATGVAVPVLVRLTRDSALGKPLVHPWLLAHMLDKETMRAIGLAYRSKIPAEDSQQELKKLLLANPKGPAIAESDDSAIRQLLETKIHSDFAASNLVMEE